MSTPNTFDSVTRRDFLKTTGTSTIAVAALSTPVFEKQADAATEPQIYGPGAVPMRFNINGVEHNLSVEPRETLLEVLRFRLDLTGTKLTCDAGNCGGCTVLINGTTRYACMTLAIEAQGQEIVTIEGIATGDKLHPVQEAFIEEDALQCGFCTPGFIISTVTAIKTNPQASVEEIKKELSGHICRCGSYNNIFKAIATAKAKMGV